MFQHVFQGFRNGKPQVCRIFQDGNTFIREIEKDDGSPYGTAFFQDGDINNVSDAYQHKDEHLLGDTLKADFAWELFVVDGTKNACDIVSDNKDDEGMKPINLPDITQETSYNRECCLYDRPDLFHVKNPPSK